MPRPDYLSRTRYFFTLLEAIPLTICQRPWTWILARMGKI